MSDEPYIVSHARMIVARYEGRQECPAITGADHACWWTCPDCHAGMPPTRERHVDGGRKLRVTCRWEAP